MILLRFCFLISKFLLFFKGFIKKGKGVFFHKDNPNYAFLMANLCCFSNLGTPTLKRDNTTSVVLSLNLNDMQ